MQIYQLENFEAIQFNLSEQIPFASLCEINKVVPVSEQGKKIETFCQQI